MESLLSVLRIMMGDSLRLGPQVLKPKIDGCTFLIINTFFFPQ
jgi:hypothetical protein